jgi:electron transport complex protein RnfC
MSFHPKHLHSINAGHYKNTAGMQCVDMPVPDTVMISMAQNIGAPCEPLVSKGDEVKVGQVIGDSKAFISAPVHSSVSGTVTDIIGMRSATGGTDRYICIDADKKQTLDENIRKPEITDKDSFIKAVRDSGLTGMGGASFPTHVKFNPKNLDEVDTFIVNGAECEPFITSDHRTMLEDTDYVISGTQTIMKWLGIEHGYIGIESNKQNAIDAFRKALADKGINDISVVTLQARYPKGAERVLIYEVTGRTVNAGMLPADVGVIVSNVSSVAFLGHYFEDGIPFIKRRVTVDGNAVKEPKNVMALIGTPISDLISFCGGYSKTPEKILFGGPMMGRAVLSDSFTLLKNNNAILAFSGKWANVPEETACIGCGRCHEACPFDLLPTGFADAYKHKDLELLEELHVNECMECGSCSFVCPAHRPLCFMNKLGKQMLKEAAKSNGK